MPPVEARTAAAVSDSGLELDAFSLATRPLPAVRARLSMSGDVSEFRRLERLLRPVRTDAAHVPGASPNEPFALSEPASVLLETVHAAPAITPTYRRPTRSSPGANLLLVSGATSLLTGLFLLIAANMLLHPAAWRWGFAAAVGGQGLLLAALAIMAIRLWRNSRRLNQQLEVVDRRLDEVQSALTQPSAELSTGTPRSTLRRLDRPADFSPALG